MTKYCGTAFVTLIALVVMILRAIMAGGIA